MKLIPILIGLLMILPAGFAESQQNDESNVITVEQSLILEIAYHARWNKTFFLIEKHCTFTGTCEDAYEPMDKHGLVDYILAFRESNEFFNIASISVDHVSRPQDTHCEFRVEPRILVRGNLIGLIFDPVGMYENCQIYINYYNTSGINNYTIKIWNPEPHIVWFDENGSMTNHEKPKDIFDPDIYQTFGSNDTIYLKKCENNNGELCKPEFIYLKGGTPLWICNFFNLKMEINSIRLRDLEVSSNSDTFSITILMGNTDSEVLKGLDSREYILSNSTMYKMVFQLSDCSLVSILEIFNVYLLMGSSRWNMVVASGENLYHQFDNQFIINDSINNSTPKSIHANYLFIMAAYDENNSRIKLKFNDRYFQYSKELIVNISDFEELWIFSSQIYILQYTESGHNITGAGTSSIHIIDLPFKDIDNDLIWDEFDNCKDLSNVFQNDSDNDGLGDLCDIETPIEPIVENETLEVNETLDEKADDLFDPPLLNNTDIDLADNNDPKSWDKLILFSTIFIIIILSFIGFIIASKNNPGNNN